MKPDPSYQPIYNKDMDIVVVMSVQAFIQYNCQHAYFAHMVTLVNRMMNIAISTKQCAMKILLGFRFIATFLRIYNVKRDVNERWTSCCSYMSKTISRAKPHIHQPASNIFHQTKFTLHLCLLPVSSTRLQKEDTDVYNNKA